MNQSNFKKIIEQKLKPKLLELDFEQVSLEGCIQPEVLYNNGRLWFGASWDYRDRYLEVSLGHLYWFKDVMPRVIILGNYESYCGKLTNLPTNGQDNLNAIVDFLNDTIESAVEKYHTYYDQILNGKLNPKKPKDMKAFLLHLEREVKYEEIENYREKNTRWFSAIFDHWKKHNN